LSFADPAGMLLVFQGAGLLTVNRSVTTQTLHLARNPRISELADFAAPFP